MRLMSFFKDAVESVSRYLENQEISSLKEAKALAEKQVGYVAARGGAVKVKISPEKAQHIIETCDQRLAVIEQKRNPANVRSFQLNNG